MIALRRFVVFTFATALLMVLTFPAQAQGYIDMTMDQYFIYADLYDDAPGGAPNCPEYTHFSFNWVGTIGNATAYYPNTAHLAMSKVNYFDTSYPGSEEITHYGQQRGGKCGPFLDHVIPVSLATRTSYFGPLRAASGGFCSYSSLACKSPTNATCPAPHITTFSYPGCKTYIRSEFLFFQGQCESPSVDFAADGPGPCT